MNWEGQVTIINKDATKIHVWTSESSDRTWNGNAGNGIEAGKTMKIKASVATDAGEAKPLYLFAGRNGQVLDSTQIYPQNDHFEMQYSWDGTRLTL